MEVARTITPRLVAGVIICISVGYGLYRTLGKRKVKLIAPKDTVVLYQIGRGPAAPSLSPFPMKLETYLRMANIPYVNDHTFRVSKKGKTPCIEYNGIEIADSQFCIEFLNKTLGIDMNQHLTAEQRAVARAFLKMTEENLYWAFALERWVYSDGEYFDSILKNSMDRFSVWLFKRSLRKKVLQATWGHGIGRHSQQEVWSIFKADMQALSDFIGNKHFLFGDNPCETDCAIFGMLGQILWHSEGSRYKTLMEESLPNLVAYCERMKDTFWPDWKECINPSLLK